MDREDVTSKIGSNAEEKRLIQRAIASDRHKVKAVVISDYATRGWLPTPWRSAIIKAAQKRKQVYLSWSIPKPSSYHFFAGATLLKPNRRELTRATGMKVGTDDEIVAAAHKLDRHIWRRIHHRHTKRAGHVRLSAAITAMPVHMRTEAKEVFDVSGAGDTVAATIALALGSGATIVEAAELANLRCRHRRSQDRHRAGAASTNCATCCAIRKTCGIAQVPDRWTISWIKFERWRTRGVQNGLYQRHFRYSAYRAIFRIDRRRRGGNCDRLIVGLNSDDSVPRA